MKFHPNKCKTLHLGYNNNRNEYYIKGEKIKTVSEEKDLGVIMTEDMKAKRHIVKSPMAEKEK